MIFRILEDQHAEKARAAKAADRRFMQLALTLGRRGLGRTAPNPAVGAVVVKDGIILGRGWTQDGGRPHAEPEALRRAGAAAKGATIYVTLEPCSHTGRSPPCADALIAAGVARVVSAMEDPNPLVAGQGHAKLRAAGIVVDVGLCADEARRDHAGHIRRVVDRRPHVVLKLAVSQDDKIGAAGRKRVSITGDIARSRVHLLRARSDAILVGIGTAMADDPELTCRLPGMVAQSPVRIVLDRALRLSSDSKLVHSARATPVWVVASETAEAAAAMRLGAAGATIIRLPPQDKLGVDLNAVMQHLYARDITRIVVEGGSRIAAAFMSANLVDEVWLLRGPATIGSDGIDALDGLPLSAITESPTLTQQSSETLGDDTLTIYRRTV
jgi:diaminohydroxyphosphoribosylaminopyrimidine deaminase/5-amino-6-(5-phosphoribosylamino)uracil reductase